jgi:KaiC/GvpD/RAD55 family RecA-like ATPase
MKKLDEIKRNVNLIEYAKRRYGYQCKISDNGKKAIGSCFLPSHDGPDLGNPSLSIFFSKELKEWRFKCHDEGLTGSIIDVAMKKEGLSEHEAIVSLLIEFPYGDTGLIFERKHIYRDAEGKPVRVKAKYRMDTGGKTWKWWHYDGNGRIKSGEGSLFGTIPYRLDEFKWAITAFVMEGEKDADTMWDLGFLGTTSPNGKGSWPNDINQYFSEFKYIFFIYDVGNEQETERYAVQLKSKFPQIKIFVCKVPLTKKEADITDLLNSGPDRTKEEKQKVIYDIIRKSKVISPEGEGQRLGKAGIVDELKTETIEDILRMPEQKIDRLIDPIVERNGFTLIGGMKGIGKSLFVTNMALYYATGKSDFLTFAIKKPGKVLLIQQEVSRIGFRDRIKKITRDGDFDSTLAKHFTVLTTTGTPLKLYRSQDLDRIKKEIAKAKPDITIFDPLETFVSNENDPRHMPQIVDALNRLKTEFETAIVVVHHISSKQNPKSPFYPITLAGLFRGHSSLSDAADVLVGLLWLPQNFKQQTLPLPYENYCKVEIHTRHGEKPADFCIERPERGLIFRLSNIWHESGRKICPWEILEMLRGNGGAMPQADIIRHYSGKAHENTVIKAIQELETEGKISRTPAPGKGRPLLIQLKQ